MRVLIAEGLAQDPSFLDALQHRVPEIEIRLWPRDQPDPATELLIAWSTPQGLLPPPGLKAIQVFGAGVDRLNPAFVPPGVPVVRLLDEGQADRMLDHVAMIAFAQLIGLPEYRRRQQQAVWQPADRRERRAFRIAVLGLGRIGGPVARGLARFGFAVSGWSARPRRMESVACFYGPRGLGDAVGGADLAVCLLPLTAQTRGILADPLFRQLRESAAIASVGRGDHLGEDDLRRVLDEGWLSHAWLDTLPGEPIPNDHWAWAHPRVTITPHIAAHPTAEGAAASVAAVIAALRQGDRLPGLVDLRTGYESAP